MKNDKQFFKYFPFQFSSIIIFILFVLSSLYVLLICYEINKKNVFLSYYIFIWREMRDFKILQEIKRENDERG